MGNQSLCSPCQSLCAHWLADEGFVGILTSPWYKFAEFDKGSVRYTKLIVSMCEVLKV